MSVRSGSGRGSSSGSADLHTLTGFGSHATRTSTNTNPCDSTRNRNSTAQAGQDLWVLHQLQLRCGHGTFVEFGARNGVDHSNTLYFERALGWRGILVEADPTQYRNLEANRPRSWTYHGAVCTRGAGNTTRFSIAGPKNGGWSGMRETMEPTRKAKMARNVDVPCYYLPDLLERHGLRRVDYLTIDTEGSELSFVEDFPWAEWDIRVVQIEQLDELRYKAQRGREGKITAHMHANGFELQNRFVVQQRDTFDLVYVPKRDFVEALPQGGNVRPASMPFGRPATRSTSARRSYSYEK